MIIITSIIIIIVIITVVDALYEEYLFRIMQSYLSDRVLLYDTTDGLRTKVITAAAVQGSVVGSDIQKALAL